MFTAEIFVLLSFFLGGLIVWWPNIWIRTISYILILIVFIFVWQFSLGYPRRIYLSPIGFPAGKVIASKISEPNFIYLWVLPKNSIVPISILIPWREKTAEELQKAKETQRATRKPILVNPNSGELFSISKGSPALSKFLGWLGLKRKNGAPGQNRNPVFYSGVPNRLPPKTK